MQTLIRTVALIVVAATAGACSSGSSGTTPSGLSAPVGSAGLGASPAASVTEPTATPGVESDDLAARVVIAALDIDLPVVSGDLKVEGNPPDYPLCDVAQYLTTYRYPGRPGTTTWIYAHAREGMFLPLLEASERNDGASLVGVEVEVYSTESLLYTYRISEVHRHALDRSIGARVPPDQRRLVLQTSEGPSGTVPKLQISADFVSVTRSPHAHAAPSAVPRECAS